VKIAALIQARGAQYVLALKGNQGALAEEVEEAFIDADAREYDGAITEVIETTGTGHGRRETRRYRTVASLEGVTRSALWEGLNMLGMVEATRAQRHPHPGDAFHHG
jgi:hypothetical protein